MTNRRGDCLYAFLNLREDIKSRYSKGFYQSQIWRDLGGKEFMSYVQFNRLFNQFIFSKTNKNSEDNEKDQVQNDIDIFLSQKDETQKEGLGKVKKAISINEDTSVPDSINLNESSF